MPKIEGQAYIQTRIIFVDNCEECPYTKDKYCYGINKSRKRNGGGRELPTFYPIVPDWCPLDGADIC